MDRIVSFVEATRLHRRSRVAELGLKAATLVELVPMEGIEVPEGFVIPVTLAREIAASGLSDEVFESVVGALELLAESTGADFGTGPGSFAVSVRSSGPVSMPGMMDTVLGVESLSALRGAVIDVARSFRSGRAEAYRAHRDIDRSACAVVVQRMVWGNADDRSAAGVALSHDPRRGSRRLTGDVAFGAMGSAVAGGSARVSGIDELAVRLPSVHEELRDTVGRIEAHLGGPCEVEFTVESGRLFVLQARRSEMAEMAEMAGPSTGDEDEPEVFAVGTPASPGRGRGVLVTDAGAVAAIVAGGTPVVLARPETSPGDVPAMVRSAAILTSFGGMASHAAVIARSEGVPAVVGIADMVVTGRGVTTSRHSVAVGDWVDVDGSTGRAMLGAPIDPDRPRSG